MCFDQTVVCLYVFGTKRCMIVCVWIKPLSACMCLDQTVVWLHVFGSNRCLLVFVWIKPPSVCIVWIKPLSACLSTGQRLGFNGQCKFQHGADFVYFHTDKQVNPLPPPPPRLPPFCASCNSELWSAYASECLYRSFGGGQNCRQQAKHSG